jgi:hypothetical protein
MIENLTPEQSLEIDQIAVNFNETIRKAAELKLANDVSSNREKQAACLQSRKILSSAHEVYQDVNKVEYHNKFVDYGIEQDYSSEDIDDFEWQQSKRRRRNRTSQLDTDVADRCEAAFKKIEITNERNMLVKQAIIDDENDEAERQRAIIDDKNDQDKRKLANNSYIDITYAEVL